MNTAREYLRLSSSYCDYLGGVRWSSREDGLEYPDGTLFAFNEEVAQFLEGFSSGGRLLHICLVLHLLGMVRDARKAFAPGSLRLSYAFADTGRSLRNAGAFCAALCRDVPAVSAPVEVLEVLDRLRNPTMPIRWYVVTFHDTFYPAELTPLGPAAFEKHVLERLEAYSTEEVRTWLLHGRGPVKEAAAALAREVPPPRSLSGSLATLLERPRLAGARLFVSQLVSALTLPLRHPALPEMPSGGYADVTTHGHPDQILPSQFALDEWDFLRRYADRELLYFRREEPHAHTRQELVAVLDQGVRTWGDVRLVLSAAVLALGRQADRRRMSFFVSATSRDGEMVDPLQVDEQVLGELVEASDLSANPGLALERVLEQPTAAARDVVLLTHPRSLLEGDLRAAARRATAGTRLFAVALDGHGHVDFSELRHGVPVPLRQFRVDFTRSEPPPAPAEPIGRPAGPWRGHVEPVGFPFRFGADGPVGPDLFDFDYEGKWLLTASRSGMLHAWRVDGQEVEVLPRGMFGGAVLTTPQVVLGVAGGFVVAGQVGSYLLAMHYNFAKRVCTAHTVRALVWTHWHWSYSREHHAVIVHNREGTYCHAIDLGTGICYPTPDVERAILTAMWPTVEAGANPGPTVENGGPVARVRAAWQAWTKRAIPPRRLLIPNSRLDSEPAPWCYLDPTDGQLHVGGLTLSWPSFTPRSDGRPSLQGYTALEAQCCGRSLAVKANRAGTTSPAYLYLFRGPPGVPLAVYPLDRGDFGFALSSDGEQVARPIKNGRVEVRPVAGGTPTVVTTLGGFSPPVEMRLGNDWLLLRTGAHHAHMVRWDATHLQWRHLRGNWYAPVGPGIFSTGPGWPQVSGDGMVGSVVGVPGWLDHDPKRFTLGATVGGLTAVADRFGQVAVFGHDKELVCMFFVFRDCLAGWLPDGTCFGPAPRTGRSATPDAPEKIARALRRASAGLPEGTARRS